MGAQWCTEGSPGHYTEKEFGLSAKRERSFNTAQEKALHAIGPSHHMDQP